MKSHLYLSNEQLTTSNDTNMIENCVIYKEIQYNDTIHLYLRDAVMAVKCMTGLSPNYLSNKFISRGSISGRATRNSQKLNIPLCKSATGQRSFYYRIVSIWNTISPTLKLSQCVNSFKRNLKLDLLKEFLS